MRAFSRSHCSFSSFCFCFNSFKSLSNLLSLSLDALSVSFFKDNFSISNFSTALSISSSSVGLEVISIFSFAAASSTRSMALSGKKRPVMYRSERTAAATRAPSDILTP
uniref:Uncharacterized protein n=1 Tax=Opuntia streptacantha TaxID=393608 RepID=A0A7C9D0X3_OPUST